MADISTRADPRGFSGALSFPTEQATPQRIEDSFDSASLSLFGKHSFRTKLSLMSDSIDEQDVTRRALAAYFRSGGIDQPANSGVIEYNGKAYVVLENFNGILAVYRIRNDGMLKRLRRWPTDLIIYLRSAIPGDVPDQLGSPADWWEPRPWQTPSSI
jgi:hypothetical protein